MLERVSELELYRTQLLNMNSETFQLLIFTTFPRVTARLKF